MAEDEVIVTTGATAYSYRRVRFGLSLGGGVARSDNATDPLAALSGRLDYGYVNLAGIEASLWLVGLRAEGQLLATYARRVGRLELGAGAGVHIGTGVGPGVGVTARYGVSRHGGVYLRYDGSLLYHDGTKTGDNAGTAGLEYRW